MARSLEGAAARVRRARRLRALAALCSAVAACASGSANRIEEGHAGAPGVRRVLLCPPNLVIALPAEVHSGSAPADREVAAYLESAGRTVLRVDLLAGRQRWKEAVAAARAAGSLERAPGLFAEGLARTQDFDAIVMPSLILHQTRMDSSNASWDGVSRRMKMANAPVRGVGRDQSTLAMGVAFGGISGSAWVTSLHVLVFARDGSRVFEGRGGIEFLHEIDLIDEGRSFRYQLRENSSLFLDRALLHEGVVRAFEPWLRPPDA